MFTIFFTEISLFCSSISEEWIFASRAEVRLILFVPNFYKLPIHNSRCFYVIECASVLSSTKLNNFVVNCAKYCCHYLRWLRLFSVLFLIWLFKFVSGGDKTRKEIPWYFTFSVVFLMIIAELFLNYCCKISGAMLMAVGGIINTKNNKGFCDYTSTPI